MGKIRTTAVKAIVIAREVVELPFLVLGIAVGGLNGWIEVKERMANNAANKVVTWLNTLCSYGEKKEESTEEEDA